MIAITSSFGAGKSSITDLLYDIRKGNKKEQIIKVSMWSQLYATCRDDEEQSGRSDERDIKEMHKNFLYQLVSQLDKKRGTYVIKKLSSNYDVLKPHEVVRIKAVYMPSEMRAAIRSAGLSEYSFTKLRLKDVKQLTAEERKALKQIRESVPMPNSDTRMQKIIPIEDVDKYVSGEYSIRGFVSRADDGLFKNPTDAFDSLRLDYKETKFVRRGDSVGIIRYSTAESADAKIPYSPELGGTFEFDSPFTGNGFTKSLNGHIVPEYHTKELEQLNPGSKMYELKTDGTLTEIAEYVKGEVWIRK